MTLFTPLGYEVGPAPTRSLLGDRCPDHGGPVVYPFSVHVKADGSLGAFYRCPDDSRQWHCSWDMQASGWTWADVLCHRMDCEHCTSEIRLTEGTRGHRIRVIHEAACPWLAKHLAGVPGFYGGVPCGATVTHRGPYRRDPGLAGVIPLTPASTPDAA